MWFTSTWLMSSDHPWEPFPTDPSMAIYMPKTCEFGSRSPVDPLMSCLIHCVLHTLPPIYWGLKYCASMLQDWRNLQFFTSPKTGNWWANQLYSCTEKFLYRMSNHQDNHNNLPIVNDKGLSTTSIFYHLVLLSLLQYKVNTVKRVNIFGWYGSQTISLLYYTFRVQLLLL